MQGLQRTLALQLLKGRRHLLRTRIGIEQLAMHAGGSMANQLQGQRFDACGVETTENMKNPHPNPSSSP
jgi:hypothetical protein